MKMSHVACRKVKNETIIVSDKEDDPLHYLNPSPSQINWNLEDRAANSQPPFPFRFICLSSPISALPHGKRAR